MDMEPLFHQSLVNADAINTSPNCVGFEDKANVYLGPP